MLEEKNILQNNLILIDHTHMLRILLLGLIIAKQCRIKLPKNKQNVEYYGFLCPLFLLTEINVMQEYFVFFLNFTTFI
jgi:hypothetical protein